jgi:transcription-repair coupling factor (superfamily II helicase)
VREESEVEELRAELVDRYGEPSASVETLLEVARLRVRIREAGLTEVTAAGSNVRFAGAALPESTQLRLRRVYPKSIYKQAAEVALVPHPRTAPVGGQPLRDRELLEWTRTVIDTLVPAG